MIAEVKQGRASHGAPFIRLMQAYHIRPTGFSKYCIGASLLYPDLKQNHFKQKHRLLAKLATADLSLAPSNPRAGELLPWMSPNLALEGGHRELHRSL